jgi:hypothetical protein
MVARRSLVGLPIRLEHLRQIGLGVIDLATSFDGPGQTARLVNRRSGECHLIGVEGTRRVHHSLRQQHRLKSLVGHAWTRTRNQTVTSEPINYNDRDKSSGWQSIWFDL